MLVLKVGLINSSLFPKLVLLFLHEGLVMVMKVKLGILQSEINAY